MIIYPHQEELAENLSYISTLRLLVYTTLSLGVYAGYYIRRQSLILNNALEDRHHINQNFVSFVFYYCWFGFFLMLGYLFSWGAYEQKLDVLTDIDAIVYGILTTFWAYQSVGRLNYLMMAEKGHQFYSGKILTIILSIYYLNYRINKIKTMI